MNGSLGSNTDTLNTTYQIDGFRSLNDFSITLTPGLNVLVGPNGSGKTNYIDFLGFLDSVLRQGASTAVSRSGGIARVFSIENSKKKSPSIAAHVHGHAEITQPKSEGGGIIIFNFDYEIEIKFSKVNSAIFISKEILKLKKARRLEDEHLAESPIGVLSLVRRSPAEESPPVWNVGRRLFADNPRNPMAIRNNLYSSRPPKLILERIEPMQLAPDESFLSIRPIIPAIDAVRSAITRGRSFNIDPAIAREPDDLTRGPGLGRDGSGLSSTLHYLHMVKSRRIVRGSYRMRRAMPETFDMIIEWTKLVFQQLQGISIAQDLHSGTYLGHLIVGNEHPVKIPLQAASDGTIKWLALVSMILSEADTYSIEEPENFLHPKMQQFLVELFRVVLEDEQKKNYFVVSSHSETMINMCLPRELIIFRYVDGKTSCGRLSAPERVIEEINKTGFGLGYYYASNALS